MVLEEELRYFDSQRAELLKYYSGQIALIKGDRLIGTFTTTTEAFEEGVRQFGTQPFLLKAVAEQDAIVDVPALNVGALSAHS